MPIKKSTTNRFVWIKCLTSVENCFVDKQKRVENKKKNKQWKVSRLESKWEEKKFKDICAISGFPGNTRVHRVHNQCENKVLLTVSSIIDQIKLSRRPRLEKFCKFLPNVLIFSLQTLPDSTNFIDTFRLLHREMSRQSCRCLYHVQVKISSLLLFKSPTSSSSFDSIRKIRVGFSRSLDSLQPT